MKKMFHSTLFSTVIIAAFLLLGVSEGKAQCTAPSGLSASAATSTSASLSWTGGSGSSWEIQYGPTGFTLGSGSTQNAASTSATVGSLLPNVVYDVYVRGNCGGSFSTWTGPQTMNGLTVNCDNFDNYSVGAAGVQSTLITDWAGNGGDAQYSTEYANSGNNSLKIYNGPNGFSDVVAEMQTFNSGIHNVQFDIYIPSGNGGYYNILHNYAGAASVWAIEVYMDMNGTAEVQEGSNGSGVIGTYNFNLGAWNTIEHIIDLDNDTAFIIVNNQFTDVGWEFSLGSTNMGDQFNAVNFYSAAPTLQTPLEYFDNFCVTDAPIDDVGMETFLGLNPPICGDSSYMLEAVVSNYAMNNQSNFPINVTATGAATANISTTYPGTLKPGESDTILYGPINTLSGGNVSFNASTNLVGDTDPLNDGVSAPNITFLEGVSVQFGPPDTSYCSNDGINLFLTAQNSNASYLWNDNTTAPSKTADTAGIYQVTVTHNNGCSASDGIDVSEIQSPSVDLGPDLEACEGANVSYFLNAQNSGLDFLWSTNETTQFIQATSFGDYSVTVTNNEGCDDVDTIEVVELPKPVIGFEDIEACGGDTIILDAGNLGSTYSWNVPNHTDRTYEVKQSGTYIVTVIDPNGCENIDTSEVTINPQPFVILGPDKTIGQGQSVTLDAGNPGATYLWSTGATSQTITVNSAGTYSVTVTNQFDCEGEDEVKVKKSVGIDEQLIGSLELFPNPVSTQATLKTNLTQGGVLEIELKSIQGKLIRTDKENVSTGQQLIPIDMSGFSSGNYLIDLSLDGNHLTVMKVTKL